MPIASCAPAQTPEFSTWNEWVHTPQNGFVQLLKTDSPPVISLFLYTYSFDDDDDDYDDNYDDVDVGDDDEEQFGMMT